MSKAEGFIERIPREAWAGLVIAIDPSCGSQNSMPAYALAHEGNVVDSGIIELPLKVSRAHPVEGYKAGEAYPLHLRLHMLQMRLLEICPNPNIVCLEDLPPYMAGRGGDFRTNNTIRLHQSAGCVMGTWGCAAFVPVAIRSHQCLMQKLTNGKYVKSDEHDALSILASAFHQAGEVLKNLEQLIEECTRSDS